MLKFSSKWQWDLAGTHPDRYSPRKFSVWLRSFQGRQIPCKATSTGGAATYDSRVSPPTHQKRKKEKAQRYPPSNSNRPIMSSSALNWALPSLTTVKLSKSPMEPGLNLPALTHLWRRHSRKSWFWFKHIPVKRCYGSCTVNSVSILVFRLST